MPEGHAELPDEGMPEDFHEWEYDGGSEDDEYE